MTVTVYLEGRLCDDKQHIMLPLSSTAVLLVVGYASSSDFYLTFTSSSKSASKPIGYVKILTSGLGKLQYGFLESESVPELVRNVLFPAVLDAEARMVRSGLCVVIRHIIKTANTVCPGQHLNNLLGFRQGSLRMCAEVSGWTKLCEVDLPRSVAQLVFSITSLHTERATREVELPTDLIKLEAHFEKPPKVHNDDKRRRKELSQLQADLSDPQQCADILKGAKMEGRMFLLERYTQLSHGWKKIQLRKNLSEDHDGVSLQMLSLEEKREYAGVSKEKVSEVIGSASYLDIELKHLYSEGVEMTIADLCLFSYLYFLVEALDFDVSTLRDHLPRVLDWLRHMTQLPRLRSACLVCGLDFERLREAVNSNCSPGEEESPRLHFVKPAVQELCEDDMELSRRCRSKHKAIKPEVVEALNKMKAQGIAPVAGQHPRGSCVHLAWNTFPAFVHPKDGEVPEKRVQRKCQQLENLVTAVLEIARPGDVIVDFCSGGGHLGIAIAHLLPHCMVYLVENKEESLVKALSRMAQMTAKNIVLYQCNLDYFVGQFDVGVCLHACGSATDMVLHQCLLNQAAFVICPCCYGSIQRTHLLNYPRSGLFQNKGVTYGDFLTLGHAADQTEFNIALEQQGRMCMNLVDSDRAHLAQEAGYSVTLTSLQPLTCTPKNNLLIGCKRLSSS